MYIQNRRNSGKFKGCSPLQLYLGLIGLKSAIAYFAYTKRYAQVNVRHEAVRITVKRSLITKNDLTSCSIMSNLPAHASMATLGCEAAGTKLPED